jgi:TetR/AcrR family transcriptional regulator, cholesterol catabolism regulator
MLERASPAYCARRAEIIQAAAEVFCESGFGPARLGDVARRLGTERSSLYYYFGSKEELLDAIILDSLEHDLATMAEAELGDGDSRSRVRTLIHAIVLRYSDSVAVTSVYLAERGHVAHGPGPLAAAIVEATEDLARRTDAILAAGVADGSLRPEPPLELVRLALAGMINWLHRWYRPWSDSDPERIAAAFTALFLDGVRAAGEPAQPGETANG